MTNKRLCYPLKLKNKNCQDIKNTAPLFLFPKEQMYHNQPVYFHFYVTVFNF